MGSSDSGAATAIRTPTGTPVEQEQGGTASHPAAYPEVVPVGATEWLDGFLDALSFDSSRSFRPP